MLLSIGCGLLTLRSDLLDVFLIDTRRPPHLLRIILARKAEHTTREYDSAALHPPSFVIPGGPLPDATQGHQVGNCHEHEHVCCRKALRRQAMHTGATTTHLESDYSSKVGWKRPRCHRARVHVTQHANQVVRHDERAEFAQHKVEQHERRKDGSKCPTHKVHAIARRCTAV